MAKRPKTARTKPVRQPSPLTNKVDGILQRLEATYALGTEALAETKKHQTSLNGKPDPKKPHPTRSSKRHPPRTRYASGVITGLVKKHGVHLNTVETARRIAKYYPEREFRKLIRRRTKKEKLPLTANHLACLSQAGDPIVRAKFEEQALDNDWSVRQLAAAIKEDDLQRGHTKATVGNKPVIPNTLPGVVRQIIDYCDKWKRWSSTFSAEIENSKDLGPKLKRIQQRLASLDSQVDEIHEMAGALVAPRKAKPSRKSIKTKGDGRPKVKSKGSGPTRKS